MFGLFAGVMIIIATIIVELIGYIIYKKKLKEYNNVSHNLLDKEYSVYVENHVKCGMPYDEFEEYARYHMQSTQEECPYYSFNWKVLIAIIVIGLCVIGVGIWNINVSRSENAALYERYRNLQTEYIIVLNDVEDKSTIPTIMHDINDYNLSILKCRNAQNNYFTNLYLTPEYDWNNLELIDKSIYKVGGVE